MTSKMLSKIGVAVAALLLVSASAVTAGAPTEASGEWLYLPSVVGMRTAGCNTFLDTTEVGIWSGTFVGESAEVGNVVIHCNGRLGFNATVSFDSVTVGGKTGPLEMRANGVKASPEADWVGHWVILSGSGELENLRGNGTFWGPGWLESDPTAYGQIYYDGQVKFAPGN